MNNYSRLLVKWYEKNKRDLPWRTTTDPYKIWISEIILQQTRVKQGYNYYLRFIERFPSVDVLAAADEDEVLKYWQGLGYYSRARNIHAAAKQIMTSFSGRFPHTYNDVLSLKGVGDYTAAAICSFAYNLPCAVVDGNVYRVLSRLFASGVPIDSSQGKKEFKKLADAILDVENPGLHNQAIMEFGALHCLPANPDCKTCILNHLCRAYETDTVLQFPVKEKKIKTLERFFTYLYIENNGKTYLRKRQKQDIWKNLYEFPLLERSSLPEVQELTADADFNRFFTGINGVEIVNVSPVVKHILSHQIIYAQFITVRISNMEYELNDSVVVPLSEIDKYAVSRLMEMFLEQNIY